MTMPNLGADQMQDAVGKDWVLCLRLLRARGLGALLGLAGGAAGGLWVA